MSQRVFAFLFQSPGNCQKFLLGDPICREHIRYFRFSAGDGSCFVKGNDLSFSSLFQRNSSFKHNAVFSPHTVSYHNSYRCGKSKGAGTADHQYGDCPGKSKTNGLAGYEPDCQSNQSDPDHCRYKNAGYPVGDFGDRSFSSCGVADHLDDLRKGGIFSNPGGFTPEIAGLV